MCVHEVSIDPLGLEGISLEAPGLHGGSLWKIKEQIHDTVRKGRRNRNKSWEFSQ